MSYYNFSLNKYYLLDIKNILNIYLKFNNNYNIILLYFKRAIK